MVRRRLSPAEMAAAAGTLEAGKHLTDVVGQVTNLDHATGTLTLLTRRGQHVTLPLRDIVASKTLPESGSRRGGPHRTIGMTALEEIMADGWAARHQAGLGRWLLREAGGYTGRANSCLVLGEPDRPLDEALATVRSWYAERGLTPRLQLPLPPRFAPSDDPITQAAEAAGWAAGGCVLCMTASTATVRRAAPAPAPDVTIETSPEITDAWWSLADARMHQHEASARAVLANATTRFATLTTGGAPTSRARLALHDDWAGIFALETRVEARGRGYGAALLGRCADEALEQGATSLYLQVAADNATATRLYERLGFVRHHSYVYLTAPTST